MYWFLRNSTHSTVSASYWTGSPILLLFFFLDACGRGSFPYGAEMVLPGCCTAKKPHFAHLNFATSLDEGSSWLAVLLRSLGLGLGFLGRCEAGSEVS